MAANVPPIGELSPVEGVHIGTANAGIKQTERHDITVFLLAESATVAGVFTQSTFRAAPVEIASAHLEDARALVINSGNANAATGERGRVDALDVCESVAGSLTEVVREQVLPFSTGVIGEYLPVKAMQDTVAVAAQRLSPNAWNAAAEAIMTTDTVPKGVSAEVVVDGHRVQITGIAKGSGMIKPDMATLLAFMAVDAAVPQPLLQAMLKRVADVSFNRVTVDGDTSTNDSFMLIASGAGPLVIREAGEASEALERAITEVAQELARRIARDGEGASKFVTVRVRGGRNSRECLDVAYTVAESPLVKTALFAGDPNWGRFCMAIGRSGVDIDPGRIALWIDDVAIAEGGMVAPGYDESHAATVMASDELTVLIDLGMGDVEEWVWTCDFSYDYVKINAEYRT